jgi:hypothetical protein
MSNSNSLRLPPAASLLKVVLENLNTLMPGHPDVAAIAEFYREATGVEARSPEPVAWPPILSIDTNSWPASKKSAVPCSRRIL